MRGNRLLKIIDFYIGVPLVWLLGRLCKKPAAIDRAFKKILLIKFSAMGDSVVLIPAVRELRKKFPDATITVVCTKINKDIFQLCPYVNKTIVFDVKKIINPLYSLRLFGEERFDAAIDFDQWLRVSPVLSFLSKAKIRIGFETDSQFRHYSYTHPVKHCKDKHEIECFFDLIRPLGVEPTDDKLEFWIEPETMKQAGEILKSAGIEADDSFITIHPETPPHRKQGHWPTENYIELGKRLHAKYGCKLLVSGTKNEMVSNTHIVSSLRPFAFLMPPVNIRELSAIFSKSKLMICGNTGVMHLACAVGTRVVALHGPTGPDKWGPLGEKCVAVKSSLECSPCLYLGFEYACKTNRCMAAISVDEVEKAVGDLLG